MIQRINISIADAGSKYTATDVEGALQELPKPDRTIYGTAADGATSGAIDPNTITKSGFYYVLSHAKLSRWFWRRAYSACTFDG